MYKQGFNRLDGKIIDSYFDIQNNFSAVLILEIFIFLLDLCAVQLKALNILRF